MIKNNNLKYNILFIGPIPPEAGGRKPGGIATHLWQLANYSQKAGYEIYILTNADTLHNKKGIHIINFNCMHRAIALVKAFKDYLFIDNNKYSFLTSFRIIKRLAILYRARILKETLKNVKPDLIHIHSLHNTTALSYRLISCNLPMIITDHAFWQGIKQKSDINKIQHVLDNTKSLICVSELCREKYRSFNLNYKGDIKVIHNPIEVSKIPLFNREEIKQKLLLDKDIILFSGVSEAISRKGLDILLKAFEVSNHIKDKCKLVIITNDEGKQYADNFFKRIAIDGIVLGPQPWERIIEYYNSASVFVMPSKSEGFALVYIEALLAGCPVIGYHKSLEEIETLLEMHIGEKFNADIEDENNLATKIIKVLNTNFNRVILRQRMIEKLSWDTKFPEFNKVYQRELSQFKN